MGVLLLIFTSINFLCELLFSIFILVFFYSNTFAQQTQKPVIYGKNWVAITGAPAATAGSIVFQKGGNAVDAAWPCWLPPAPWGRLSWGGETQAPIYNPKTGKIIAINAGCCTYRATDFFKSKMNYRGIWSARAVTPEHQAGSAPCLRNTVR
jgi:gamma-glutamyltranspeptidase/glutathione hydrolase